VNVGDWRGVELSFILRRVLPGEFGIAFLVTSVYAPITLAPSPCQAYVSAASGYDHPFEV
jgi:hypothetical protein